jgi:molybdate transport system substrate-binding protein
MGLGPVVWSRAMGLRVLRGLLSALMLFVLDAGRAVAAPPNGGTAGGVTLTVFAAASLHDVFGELGSTFERAHPGVKAQFNFAGSQELRTQIEQGAPADVFASADPKHMDAAHRAGLVDAPKLFATNAPVIVVPADNPAKVKSLADLTTVKRLVIGTPEVPIGAYTLQILDKARSFYGADFPKRVQERVASREFNVRQVLAKVSLGEADAGIVYRTDARSAGDKVRIVEIPAEFNVVAKYPIATVTRTPNAELARAWVALVTGPTGQVALERAGFGTIESHPWRRHTLRAQGGP